MKDIIDLLKLADYKGESELIDIAKGKYKIPNTIKEAYKQFKRDLSNLKSK